VHYFDESGHFAFLESRYDVYVQAALICPDSFVDPVHPVSKGVVLMKRVVLAILVMIAFVAVPSATAGAATSTTYYLSLGDSLAASFQPNGDLAHGYAEQLHGALAEDDPKLELKKLGCGGESTVSMRFGSQVPTVVLSCGAPRDYKELFPKGTQLAEAVSFLEAHKEKVALVTIDLGANDVYRLDSDGSVVSCLFEAAGCDAEGARLARNLAAILAELRAAAGPEVPIVGMTYYSVYAPICVSAPWLAFICSRGDALNALIADTYAAAGVPVADVAGAFENDVLPNAAVNVCAWTWFCTIGDVHPNTAGYHVIARAFLGALS